MTEHGIRMDFLLLLTNTVVINVGWNLSDGFCV